MWYLNLTQISLSFPCFLIKTEMEREVSKERSKNTPFCWSWSGVVEQKYRGNPFSFHPDWNRLTSSFLPICSSASCLMVYCIISVSSFLFLGLRNPHAVQFICLSVHKQQFKAGPGPSPFQKQKCVWARPVYYSDKPYQTEKPWTGGSVTVGKGAFRMCRFVSERSKDSVCGCVCVCLWI